MTNGGEIEIIDGGAEVLTMWDRRMVAAIATATSARKGVLVLRIVAAVVATAAVVGDWMIVMDDNWSDFASGRSQWGQFLSSVSVPVAFAGMVLAASYLLSVYAARLDMDIVLADDEEVGRMKAEPDTDGDSGFKP